MMAVFFELRSPGIQQREPCNQKHIETQLFTGAAYNQQNFYLRW